MRAMVRADASPQIGTGHVVRCLTLANALHEDGVTTTFASRALPASLVDLVRSHGHAYRDLSFAASEPSDGDLRHSHWLGTSQRADAVAAARLTNEGSFDWVIVDHYALDARWETEARRTGARVCVIDDLADRLHDCDVLIDQNFAPDADARYDGKVPSDCIRLMGPHYALLRREFCEAREQASVPRLAMRRILISFGGLDATDETSRAIKAVAGQGTAIAADVVIGVEHPAKDRIEEACRAAGFALHVQTREMARLMQRADLAFGASGSSSWERCAVGLPAICVATAFNQVAILEGLVELGVVVPAVAGSSASYAEALSDLMATPDRLAAMSSRAAGVVDGLGAWRVSARMLSA